MQKLRNAMYKISYGRYGTDEFSKFLLYGGLGVFAVYLITGINIFYFAAMLFLVYNVFRSYSKNFESRRKERDIYLFYRSKANAKLALQKRKWNERHTHCFFKCPCCKTVVRVPKGKGKIEISCPKCNNKFIKKT